MENAADILEELALPLVERNKQASDTSQYGGLTDNEQQVYQLLSSELCHIDTVIGESGLSAAKVSATLMLLEMQGLVKQFPGKFFVK